MNKKRKAFYIVLGAVLFGATAACVFVLVLCSLGYDSNFLHAVKEGEGAIKNQTAIASTGQTSEEINSSKTTDQAAENGQDFPANTVQVTDVTQVVSDVMPGVVAISGTYKVMENYWGYETEQEQEGSGSGIIIGQNDTELLIVTNNHVVQDSTTLMVQFIDETTADAQIKGTDSAADLAVVCVKLKDLETKTKETIKIAEMGESDNLQVGEPAIAIGNALGYGQSVTTGVVSAVNRSYVMDESGESKTLIQTDAAINPGNSGGALLNMEGKVIGINSNKLAGETIEGMGYAIPISSAEPILEKLMSKKTREKVEENKAYLGVSGINVTKDVTEAYGTPVGVYVAQVYDDSAAMAAGITKGDVIVSFDGELVETMEDLSSLLDTYEAGTTIEIGVMKLSDNGYEEQNLEITLGKKE